MSDARRGARGASRPLVVCNKPLPDVEQRDRLHSLAEVVVASGEDLTVALADADAAIVIRPERLTRQAIEKAPRLRAVATLTAGSDHIDAEALAERGISLIVGVGAGPSAVAEWVVWATLAMRRGLREMAGRFERGDLDWATRFVGHRSAELSTATVGIAGFGNIGRAVHQLLAAFGPRFVVYDESDVELPPGCDRASDIAELCDAADVLTLHVPMLESTKGLISGDELRRLGAGGLLVNAARGGVVDQPALIEALASGTLGAAALDCFEPEPPDAALVRSLVATGRVLLTPHVAGVSTESFAALSKVAVDGIERCLR